MERDRGATTFVTAAAGFIGSELVKVLMSGGHHVVALIPTMQDARALRRAGATPVLGDLSTPGQWQDEAAAEWVFHLPDSDARTRTSTDAHLLDAIASGTTRRIVYVADARWYGATGARPITEDETPVPSGAARRFLRTLNRLDEYAVAGMPIVTALPGYVYGKGSRFNTRIVTTGPWISPIHVHDCARALVHLAKHGEPGSRYFLVNDDPIQLHEFAQTFARLANRPLRVWRVPLARFGRGHNAVFSNIRLRSLGFRFLYPTIEHGLAQMLGARDE
jgi:nucleoside-diphosphate-sugar epimerase